jgi:hypothetical protein
MKPNELLNQVMGLSLDNLEIFRDIINDKVERLSQEETYILSSKSNATKVVKAFAKEGLHLVNKGPGRKKDSYSNAGLVRASLSKLFDENPDGVHMSSQWERIAKETGLSIDLCKKTASPLAGYDRNSGFWKKAA